jgi:hypothetical protein
MNPLLQSLTQSLYGTLCIAIAVATLPAQDTVRMVSTSAPAWGAKVQLTPVWTIGQIDGPDELAFGSVMGFAVDKTGRFYVYDGKDAQIRQYDTQGKFLRAIGRKGKGPGEYGWVTGMAIANDSLLVIHDLEAARVTYFTPAGTVSNEFVEPRATWGADQGFVVDTRGYVYLRVPNVSGATAGGGERETVRNQVILRMNADGKRVDSLLVPTARATAMGFYLSTADGGNNNFIAGSRSASLPGGGFVFGHEDALRLIIKPGTGPVRIVERAWTPVTIGGEERSGWLEWSAYNSARNNGRTTYTIPKTKPAFRGLLADNDSRIWVSMYAPAQKLDLPPRPAGDKRPLLRWQQPATYEVFSDQGSYLGRVVLPMRSRFLAARGNRLWALVKGADDEDMIRLYTINGVR